VQVDDGEVSALVASERFVAFSGLHWLLLAVFAGGVVLVVLWGRSHRGTARELPARRGYALVLGGVVVTMQAYYLLEPGGFRLGTSLPLELCDLAEIAAVVALWTRSPRATAFTYYVALTLSIQGILTPSLGQAFPTPRFLGFWTLHFLVVWAAVYLTWGLGFRPTWRLYRFACLATLLWVAVVFPLNAALDTDYGYLNRKPASASLLDLLGPWPGYVLAGAVIVLGGWALVLTLPWTLAGRAGPGDQDRSTTTGAWSDAPLP
jgi:hypothetical integral membrane protein (TIGR02206 family)